MMHPCIGCGEPYEGRGRCSDCERDRTRDRPTHTARGYNAAWERLSRQARRLQRFCTDCGATADLTVDHSPEAWERQEAGLTVRLRDVVVLCRSCNTKRGRARPRGVAPGQGHAGPRR